MEKLQIGSPQENPPELCAEEGKDIKIWKKKKDTEYSNIISVLIYCTTSNRFVMILMAANKEGNSEKRKNNSC